jgi:UDP-N-acetylmuramate dehydrogenase
VQLSVARGWAGFECLSGIPGLVGATPMQNVGAYGQDVSETVTLVRALDTTSRRIMTFENRECRFSYRDSLFRSHEPGRYVILSVAYRLRPGGSPTVRYADVEKDLAAREIDKPSLEDVRASVIAIRRSKSMVLDSTDSNRRSCGSFFTNPIIPDAELAAVESRAGDRAMPRWPLPGGQVKLSAAWLIERAGFARGDADGRVGISTKHTLALINRGGATARDVLRFATRIKRGVLDRFGISLRPEPVFVGFDHDHDLDVLTS